MIPAHDAYFGLPWTPDEAALVLAPHADRDLLAYLAARLLPEVAPGRYDAGQLLALHQALSPWIGRPPGRACADLAPTPQPARQQAGTARRVAPG